MKFLNSAVLYDLLWVASAFDALLFFYGGRYVWDTVVTANMAPTRAAPYYLHQCKQAPSGFDCAGCACDDSGYCACDECIFVPVSDRTASICQRLDNSGMWHH